MGYCDQSGLMPLAEGLEKLLAGVTPVAETEQVPLTDASGRVLAEDILAPAPVPGFDNSAMDGYAILRVSIQTDKPVPIQGKSFAGDPYRLPLKPGHAIRIMTGAAVPDGADCVIMQENAIAQDHQVTFTKLAEVGNNIRRAGEDIARGATVLKKDTRLNAAHVALLASVGCAAITVYRKTRVALLSTGDELKSPGEALALGDIYNSNGPALRTMLNRLDVELVDFGVLPDNREIFTEAFTQADAQCDFVMTSGGVSVGEADYTKEVLEALGDIAFWKLAIKPGKPFAFGHLPNSTFIGLPGNPVSAMVTFHILGSQAIRQHQHIGEQPMPRLTAKATEAIRKVPGRMDFQRGHWRQTQNGVEVSLTRTEQGSHILSSLADANCYIALEAERGDVQAGEPVTVWLFDGLL